MVSSTSSVVVVVTIVVVLVRVRRDFTVDGASGDPPRGSLSAASVLALLTFTGIARGTSSPSAVVARLPKRSNVSFRCQHASIPI